MVMFMGPYSCSLFLSKNTNIQIAFCIHNVIYNILKTRTNNTNTYMCGGTHQLQCHICHLCYIGQAGCHPQNISDISPPINPSQHMQFTFSTTDTTMDP